MRKLVGITFIIMAVLLLLSQPPAPKTSNKNPITIDPKLLFQKQTENLPVRIVIPEINIDLSVTPSRIIDGYWELSETTASYGLGSGVPKTNSNTVIFAHARPGLFYNLKDIKPNNAIYVFTKNAWRRYSVDKITQVYPNQTEVIMPTKKETLTLYTCSGFSDEKRLVITALPKPN